jgi:heterotetrameric sarcosine oxidase gamma subunit
MKFEFLAPDAAQAFNGAPPALRSPIEWAHRDAGARAGERAGWRSVSDYGDPAAEAAACERSVGVADLSYLGKLELQAAAALVSGIVADLAGGATLSLGQAALRGEVWWCPITPERVLAVTPPEATAGVRDELEAAASGESFASVQELTTALGSNAVVGPLAREAFARSTALDMRPGVFGEGAFAPVSVARVPGMVLRTGGDSFLHLFGAGYAQYIWTVFVDAAEHLGGRAVGVDAVRGEARSDA